MRDVLDYADEWGPEKVVVVHDTRTGMRGLLVIDNTARGMGKGGCRVAPDVTLWDCFRLARTMTWKWAMFDIQLGGAKAAIVADPKSPNKEEIIRAFVRGLGRLVPDEYVFGNDMGFVEEDGAVVIDECGGDRRVAVGVPSELGGLPYDRLGFTGYGVAEAVEVAAGQLGLNLKESTVAIQGFGAVGSFAALFLRDKGVRRIVAISTAEGALYDPQGLDVDRLLELKAKVGDRAVREYHGGSLIPAGEELRLDVDLLIPAAKGDVIREDMVDTIKAKIIIEAANFPVAPECKSVLHEKGVLVVPDFVANAGAVISTGKAMFNRYAYETLDPAEVYATIRSKMRVAVDLVLKLSKETGQRPDTVALDIAQAKVRRAMELRRRLPRAA